MMSSASKTVHGFSCGEAVAALQPCLPFLKGNSRYLNVLCCVDIRAVSDKAATTEDRRNLCQCFKKAGTAAGVKPEKARQIPKKCLMKVPVPLDPTVDCTK
ncbi:hypothetical protein MANES_13G059000v8 [Manihot esculenta]|uniref:Uncharacterized protein n=3 Tax=Manihot esculenta TaxID=3983 RepID=A0ACB7GJB7_MANES|nr:hypothetical protein MANES_13G059000v8 [Manihot esculenta]